MKTHVLLLGRQIRTGLMLDYLTIFKYTFNLYSTCLLLLILRNFNSYKKQPNHMNFQMRRSLRVIKMKKSVIN